MRNSVAKWDLHPTKFTWDTGVNGVGLPATSESPDHVVRGFDYDSAGRPWRDTWQVNGESFEVLTTYDSSGRVATQTYPNVPARSTRFTVQRAYASTGHELSVTEVDLPMVPPFWTVNGRNVDDQLLDASFGNGLVDHRTYYASTGKLQSIADGHGCATGCVGAAYSLTYDYWLDGQVKDRVDAKRSRSEKFSYDVAHRLVDWQLTNVGALRDTSYLYDEIGNLKTVSLNNSPVEVNSYECDGGVCAGPHALVKTIVGTTKSTFGYDARGRQRTAPARTVVFTDHNLPQSIGSAQFAYDAAGTRVKKNDSTGETISIGGIYERRTSGTSVQHIFYVPGTDGMMTQVVFDQPANTNRAEYLHVDALGTTGAVSNQAGTLTFYDHDPFGAAILPSGLPAAAATGDVRLGFTGHVSDDALGLVNMKGRIYDPAQRHFITPDPLIPNPLNAQSYNRYSYVENDPINRTDPSGFTPSDDNNPFAPVADLGPVFLGALFNNSAIKLAASFSAPGTPIHFPAARKFQTAVMPAPSGHVAYVPLAAPAVVPMYTFGDTEHQAAQDLIVTTFAPPAPRDFLPGRQPVRYYIGNDAHYAIADEYEAVRPGEKIFQNSIPVVTIARELGGDLKWLRNADLLLRPDIFNATTREVYEIKPVGSEPAARLKLAMYIVAISRAGIPVVAGGPGRGTSGTLPAPGGYYQYWTGEPGVISYKWITLRSRLWGVDPVYWAIGGGVMLTGAALAAPVVVGLAPAVAPEAAEGLGLLPGF